MSSDVGYYDALRNLDSDLGGFKDKSINEGKKPVNKEKEEIIVGSLTKRAETIINDPEYIQKLKDIRKGKNQCRYMDFVMDGIKIGMPYNGDKTTTGYLKKET